MSQFDFGTINPNTKSGTALATDLNSFRTALHTSHSGSTAPSYITTGMLWVDSTSANLKINMYDGAQSITVAIIDATNNVARVAADSAETSYITATTAAQIKFVIASVDTATIRSTGLQFNIAAPEILDSSNNELISFTATASAVNNIRLTNAATATNPVIAAIGGDTNIGITLTPKGTGRTNVEQLALDGTTITTTAAQLNFVTGVTSAIQTQINTKAPSASPTFTGQTAVAAGSAAAPGLIGASADTGVLISNVVQIATTGVERMRVNNVGAVSFNSSFGTSGQLLQSAAGAGPPVWVTPPLTAGFVSANQTISTAGALTLAHSLGAQPKIVHVELVCITAEAGYAVSDVLMISNNNGTTGDNRYLAVYYDATSIFIKFTSTAACFSVANASTGTMATLTNGSWRLRVRAFT